MLESRVAPLCVALGLLLSSSAVLAGGSDQTVVPAGSAAPSEQVSETDDANARRRGMETWWYETPYDAKFRRFMNQAAALERARYASRIPQATLVDPSNGSASVGAVVGNTWTSIGPTRANVAKNGGTSLNVSDSGRPVSIIPHPSVAGTIYLATAGGGVWKTTDGGSTWAPKTEALGSLSVGYMAMDPNNANKLFLGLGDAFDGTGIGLYVSSDGANSWSGPVYIGDSTVTNKIMVAPGNSQIVIAATDLGLFRSVDGGASWTAVSLATGFADTPYAWDIAFTGGSSFVASIEATHAATSGTTNGQVWTSSNNGASWTRASGPTATGGVGRISLAAAPSAPTTVYAMAAKPNATSSSDLADLFKSGNGGASWSAMGATARKIKYSNSNTESGAPATVLNGQGWYNHMLIVDRSNPNVFYFGGALLMAKATVSGSTATYTQLSNWLAQFSLPYIHADFHTAAFDSTGTLYVGTDGGIFKSTNTGYTAWTSSLNVGITSHLIYSVGSSTAYRDAVVGGFQDNGTRVRVAATSTFDQYIGGDGFGSDVNQTNASLMLGSLYYTRIYKSTNGGTTFASASTGITESNNSSSAPFNTHIERWTGDASGNTVYTHVNLKVYKSTNYAGSWTALGTSGLPTTSFAIRNIGIAHSNSNVVGIAASGGRVYLSNNGGSSWTQSGALPNNALSISDVYFDRGNPNTVYVSSVAPDATATHLWKSTNFGSSWTAIDGSGFPTGVPVNTVTADPSAPNTLFAATHLGVYSSTDAGATWTRFGNALPLVNVTDFYVSADASLMRASTFGRGIWELVP